MLTVPKVDDVDVAFPARGVELAPAWEDIPEKFKRENTVGKRLFGVLFYGEPRTKTVEWHPKRGVDKNDACRVLAVIIGCFGLKHEHKEAAFAYLVDEWFDAVSW